MNIINPHSPGLPRPGVAVSGAVAIDLAAIMGSSALNYQDVAGMKWSGLKIHV